MKIAVTGATGHLGGNLVRLLLSRSHDVSCLVRQDTRTLDGLPVRLETGDMLDRESLARLVAGADIVFHLAALISLRYKDPTGRVEKVNVQGTKNIIDACRAAGVQRLVHFGSIHVFDENLAQGMLDETTPLSTSPGLPVYDRTKAQSVLDVLDAVKTGLDAVIVCPTAVIGPFDFKPSAMGRMLQKIATAKMPVAIKGGFNWVDARDVANGAVAASQKGRTGELYIMSGRWASVQELAGLTSGAAGVRPPLWYPPIGLAMPGAMLMDAWARLRPAMEPAFTRMSLRTLRQGKTISSKKAMDELGFSPRPLDDTMGDTVDWFRMQSPGKGV